MTPSPSRAEALARDLDAFLAEHRDCGPLEGGIEGERVWLACGTCGAGIDRRAKCDLDH